MKRMLMGVNEAILVLDDESRCEVSPGDIPTICTWIPTATVEIHRTNSNAPYSYRVVNCEISVTVWERIRQ